MTLTAMDSAGMPLVPHFRVPMRLDANGSFATIEQDSSGNGLATIEIWRA